MTPKVPHGRHTRVVGHAFIVRFSFIPGLLLLAKMLNYYRFETALNMSIIQL